MIVKEYYVKTMEPVRMGLTPTHADVQMALRETNVKQTLMSVKESSVSMKEPVRMESTPILVHVPVDLVEGTVRQELTMVGVVLLEDFNSVTKNLTNVS